MMSSLGRERGEVKIYELDTITQGSREKLDV